MERVRYAAGDTTASRVKALLFWAEGARGPKARDGLLRDVRVDAEYLADETRPLSISTWAKALTAFAQTFGREALRETWSGVLHDENLAVWTRVLRGASRPEEALGQLNAFGGDVRNTYTWETLDARQGYWRGRVIVAHDPVFEQDGLWGVARAAELAAVPAMFGCGVGRVVESELLRQVGLYPAIQEYELWWRVPSARPLALTLVAATGGAASFAWLHPTAPVVAGCAAGVAVLTGVGQAMLLRAQHRAATCAQLMRIRVLERGVLLKEQREKSGGGLLEGSIVAGKYRLGRKIGTGASGVIHEAVRLSDNAAVAIKLLRAAVAHDVLASDRLRREAEALGLTWHPNVVEVYEYDHLPDGTAYLVMELLRGESLAARLRRIGRLTPGELGPIALQVCDALGAVHAAGVIHRDVKPSNIFLTVSADGSGPERVKLLDFGIARVEWAETRLTNGGVPLGTPGYMSPEQERGDELDARSDLYGLGAVLWECLTGAPPPVSSSGRFLVASHPDPGTVETAASRGVPVGWLPIVESATATVPEQRFADARAMREAIAELVRSDDSGSRPSAKGERRESAGEDAPKGAAR